MEKRKSLRSYTYEDLERILLTNDDSVRPNISKYKSQVHQVQDIATKYLFLVNYPPHKNHKLINRQRRNLQYTFRDVHVTPEEKAAVAEAEKKREERSARGSSISLSKKIGNTYSQQNRVLQMIDKKSISDGTGLASSSSSANLERRSIASQLGNYWLKTNFNDPTLLHSKATARNQDPQFIAKERQARATSYGNFWSRIHVGTALAAQTQKNTRRSEEIIDGLKSPEPQKYTSTSAFTLPVIAEKHQSEEQQNLIKFVKTPEEEATSSVTARVDSTPTLQPFASVTMSSAFPQTSEQIVAESESPATSIRGEDEDGGTAYSTPYDEEDVVSMFEDDSVVTITEAQQTLDEATFNINDDSSNIFNTRQNVNLSLMSSRQLDKYLANKREMSDINL